MNFIDYFKLKIKKHIDKKFIDMLATVNGYYLKYLEDNSIKMTSFDNAVNIILTPTKNNIKHYYINIVTLHNDIFLNTYNSTNPISLKNFCDLYQKKFH